MNGKLEDIPNETAPDQTDAIEGYIGSGTSSVRSIVGMMTAMLVGMGYLVM